jgi:peptide/nickel transport system substrate-binding protein
MESNYWSRISSQRIIRRRMLAAVGGSALGAAFLAACGGSEDGGGEEDSTGLVTKPHDTFKQAKRGGILKHANTQEPPTLDFGSPLRGHPGANSVSSFLRFEQGHLKAPGGELSPLIFESWEWSQDGLQVVMKVRQNVKWHNKAPVNGRTLDMDDVQFSYKRFADKSPNRGSVVNAVNPSAPVISFTPTDSRTVVIKLSEPVVHALELFASPGHITGNIAVLPKESDTTLDVRGDMIGTGPFVMTEYKPSIGFTFKRHPEYFDQDHVLVDQMDFPLVSEYASRLSQFKAGNIHFLATVRPEDLLVVKKDEPRILIYPSIVLAPVSQATDHLTFGLLPEGKSPFLDERVRQAVSMSWDRDLYIEVFHNISKFAAEGLPQETRWHSQVWAGHEGWWLDPQGKDFGPNAKYFKHDIAEAKKLMAAAGHPNGFNIRSSYPVSGTGSDVKRLAEVLDGMAGDIGIKTTVGPIDYATEYIPIYRDGSGQYEGWAYHSISGSNPGSLSPVRGTADMYWPKAGVTFKGFSTSGKNDQSGDPTLTSMLEKARIERDTEKRRSLLFDVQRHLGKAMWGLLQPGAATSFEMAWPAVGNYSVWFPTGVGWAHYQWWLDQTKPPFTSA